MGVRAETPSVTLNCFTNALKDRSEPRTIFYEPIVVRTPEYFRNLAKRNPVCLFYFQGWHKLGVGRGRKKKHFYLFCVTLRVFFVGHEGTNEFAKVIDEFKVSKSCFFGDFAACRLLVGFSRVYASFGEEPRPAVFTEHERNCASVSKHNTPCATYSPRFGHS